VAHIERLDETAKLMDKGATKCVQKLSDMAKKF
jgi:hypothetical protein